MSNNFLRGQGRPRSRASARKSPLLATGTGEKRKAKTTCESGQFLSAGFIIGERKLGGAYFQIIGGIPARSSMEGNDFGYWAIETHLSKHRWSFF